MQSGKRLIAALLVVALVLLGVIIGFTYRATVFSAVSWRLEGRVLDAKTTNGLAGVKISIQGTVNASMGLSGASQKTMQLETNTDDTGRYVLNFQAAAFKVTFTKPHYVDQDYAFACIGTHCDDTNQNLVILLAPE